MAAHSIFSSGDDDGVMSDINVTPLVDVVLVLLIVFMVTMPALVAVAPIKVTLPESTSATSETAPPPLVVSLQLQPDGKTAIFVNEQPSSEENLRTTIREMKVPPTEQRVTLAADKSIPYGSVVQVMDILHSLGLSKIALNTKHAAPGLK